jgi:hypothetical protein
MYINDMTEEVLNPAEIFGCLRDRKQRLIKYDIEVVFVLTMGWDLW